MQIDRARSDLVVAVAAVATTISIAVLSSVTSVVAVGQLPSVAPIGVYAAYLFSRKGGPYSAFDTTRNWAIATVLVGVLVLALAIV